MSKWYGSMVNRLEENRELSDVIEVGTGMTEYGWSDREAYEVTAVRDQKHVAVRRLDHKPIGEAYSNEWELVSNPDNPEREITKRGKYWYWTSTLTREELESVTDPYDKFRLCMAFDSDVVMEKGKQTKYTRANVSFGKASYYYDYSF